MLLDRRSSLLSTLQRVLTPGVTACVLAVGVLLVGIGGTHAQVPQKVISTECKACGPQDIHAADLSGDGTSDIVFASALDGKIAWYENNGDGTFSDQKVITTDADGAQSVYAVDLAGDGDLDVLSASRADDKIAWYENNGDGTFSGQKVITTDADGAESVYAADLTGDGKPDVLSASDEDDKIAWYENNGGGTFSDQKVITTDADGAESVYAADVNGDQEIDVLSASRFDDKIAVYGNNGDGTFSGPLAITTDADGARSVHAADLSGNGDPDVLSASTPIFGESKIAWYENQGGSFSNQNIITTGADGARSVYAEDLNDDGDPDVLSASRFDDKIAWYENNGDGTFSDQKVITTDADGAESVYAADLTGSGDPDILSASRDDYKIAWHENTGSGSFSGQEVITECKVCGPVDVHAADLTGNSDLDVLFASQLGDKIAWYENQGGGTFSDQQVITTDAGRAFSVHAADLTGNGHTDILSASSGELFDENSDDKIAWYENQGNGTFSDQQVITTDANGAESVYAADLNDDGQTDVLSASFSDDKIAWYENNGDGTFSSQKVITTAADGATSVYAADLTGSGDADVLSTSQGGSGSDPKVAWYENNGDGTFSDQKVITTAVEGARSVYVTDLTGSGDLDVLSASEDDDKIAWYENNGDGTFSEQQVITTDATGAASVYAADLNDDDEPDVLSASAGDDKIAWHENNGDGTFSGQKIVTASASGAASVYAADLTGSGEPDVLSASSADDKIAWYENTDDTLPVELAGLTARAEDTGARLTWQTASETNNAGFYVQHRAPSPTGGSPGESASEGPKWERLGFVEGAGTTTEAQSYRFAVEKDLAPGTHRFRLRQVDTDGTAHLSEAVSLRVRMNEKVRLSAPTPNPIASEARLTFSVKEPQKTTVRLYDMLGRQVATLYQGRPTAGEPVRLRLDASGLAGGTYLVRLEAEGATETQKAVVVR